MWGGPLKPPLLLPVGVPQGAALSSLAFPSHHWLLHLNNIFQKLDGTLPCASPLICSKPALNHQMERRALCHWLLNASKHSTFQYKRSNTEKVVLIWDVALMSLCKPFLNRNTIGSVCASIYTTPVNRHRDNSLSSLNRLYNFSIFSLLIWFEF